jgi:hypothetical protein
VSAVKAVVSARFMRVIAVKNGSLCRIDCDNSGVAIVPAAFAGNGSAKSAVERCQAVAGLLWLIRSGTKSA